MRILFAKMSHTLAVLSFSLLVVLSVTVGCGQNDQGATAGSTTSEPAPPAAAREEKAPPKEDYSANIMAVSRKDYEPLGRKILANHQQLSVKLAEQTAAGLVGKSDVKELEDRQWKTEADFVENMKMLDYMDEKQNSKEMTKEQAATEIAGIKKKIKGLEYDAAELEKRLKSAAN